MDIKKTEYDIAGYEACFGCGKDVDIARIHFRVKAVTTLYTDVGTGLPYGSNERTVAKDVEVLTDSVSTRALCQGCGRGERHSYHCEGF